MPILAVLPCTDVMHVKDVDPRKAEALQAVFERAHDPIIGIIEYVLERHRMAQRAVSAGLSLRAQQPTRLGREHPVTARQFAQGVADNPAGLSEAIEGRSVEITHAGRPRCFYNRLAVVSGDRDAMSAEGSGTEPQDRHSERRAPQMACLEARHAALSVVAFNSISYPITTIRCNQRYGRLHPERDQSHDRGLWINKCRSDCTGSKIASGRGDRAGRSLQRPTGR